jgi:hypothetical protein
MGNWKSSLRLTEGDRFSQPILRFRFLKKSEKTKVKKNEILKSRNLGTWKIYREKCPRQDTKYKENIPKYDWYYPISLLADCSRSRRKWSVQFVLDKNSEYSVSFCHHRLSNLPRVHIPVVQFIIRLLSDHNSSGKSDHNSSGTHGKLKSTR